jgi:hypothetical protein
MLWLSANFTIPSGLGMKPSVTAASRTLVGLKLPAFFTAAAQIMTST